MSNDFLSKDELVKRVCVYDLSADVTLIKQAYDLCVSAHGEQMRHSGQPYYAHPITVAEILVGLRMDTASICTALLHDVLEDTAISEEEMEAQFGKIITGLVKGVTKLGQLQLSSTDLSREGQQAENFQKFVLAMSKDIRVLLVKLCDRLHNMRTLQYHPKPESKIRIARETMEIYAPLARKIGVDRICSELENLSFQYLNPSAFETIGKRLDTWRSDQETAISEISIMLRDLLLEHNVKSRTYGREKRPFAIWRKLERQGITFDDIADIYAFRIIVENVETCYEILGHLHQQWRCMPGRFRDFISVPKPNGYQSLHTTILGPDNQRVEIQIRTEIMDDIAERGVAAHWSYKNESYTLDDSQMSKNYNPLERLRPLVEMMEYGGDADEFLEHAKLEMFTDQVFTFTPKNKLIALPTGATPLDFAYAVHTSVGDTCIGAQINGREKPLRTHLQNGDIVKIIRGGAPEPNPGWENMIVTGKARSALRRLTRKGESQEYQRIGDLLARHAFAREAKDFNESGLVDGLTRLSFDTVEDLYIALGRGDLSISEFMDGVFPGRGDTTLDQYVNRDLIDDNTAKLYVKGEGLREGVSLHIGDCCHPIHGDRVVGIHTPGKGVVMHTIDCDMLEAIEDQPERWIDLGWRRSAETAASIAQITATVEHVPGALADITMLIGEAGGNLTNIKTLKRSPSFFDMALSIEVRDARHLSQIVAAMRTSAYVVAVERARTDLSS